MDRHTDVHLENGKANPHVVGILILYMNVLRLSFRGKLERYAWHKDVKKVLRLVQ